MQSSLRAVLPSTLATLTVAAAFTNAAPRDIYVDASAPAGGDGTTWNTAFKELQDALDAARIASQASVTVQIAPGTYLPDRGTFSRTSRFVIEPASLTSAVTLTLKAAIPDGSAIPPGMPPLVRLSADLRRDDAPNWGNRLDNAYAVVEIRAPAPRNLTTVTLSGVEIGGAESGCFDPPYWYDDGAIKIAEGPRFLRVKLEDAVITRNRSCGNSLVEIGNAQVRFERVKIFSNDPPSYKATIRCAGSGASIHLIDCEMFDNATYYWQYAIMGNDPNTEISLFRTTLDCNAVHGIETQGYVGVSESTIRRAAGSAINARSSVFISGSVFEENGTVGLGAGNGAAVDASGFLYIRSSIFRNNVARGTGGAITSYRSIDCTTTLFLNNRVDSGTGNNTASGGACSGGGIAKFDRCTFIGNLAVSGGDIAYGGAIAMNSVTINQCLFSGNSASGADGAFGGAVFLFDAGTIGLSTFHANAVEARDPANQRGPAISGWFEGVASGSNIFWNSRGGAGLGIQRHIRSRDTFDAVTAVDCNFQGMATAPDPYGNSGADPRFADPLGPDHIAGTADDDLRLTSGSPCIDSGSNGIAAADAQYPDLDGKPRFVDDTNTRDRGDDTRVDRGAYEFQFASNPPPCWADINLDRRIDTADLTSLLRWFGSPIPVRFGPDLVPDGVVDTRDLVKLLAGFGCDQSPW